MKKVSFKDVLPEYPSTRHLPWKPNNRGDKVASEQDAAVIFEGPFISIEEKIDGANCGMAWLDGHPVVRTRTKILRKGQTLKNPSQEQFASAWNWMHERKESFDKLAEQGPYSVYGEWMIQQHGQFYNKLPDWFIAFDVYDWEKGKYIDPKKASFILEECKFESIPLSFYGDPKPVSNNLPNSGITYEFIENLANCPSWYSKSSKREGVIVKVSDGDFITHKFKMVRQGFEQGCLLSDKIKKNVLTNQIPK